MPLELRRQTMLCRRCVLQVAILNFQHFGRVFESLLARFFTLEQRSVRFRSGVAEALFVQFNGLRMDFDVAVASIDAGLALLDVVVTCLDAALKSITEQDVLAGIGVFVVGGHGEFWSGFSLVDECVLFVFCICFLG